MTIPCEQIERIVRNDQKIVTLEECVLKLTDTVQEINQKLWTSHGVVVAVIGIAGVISFVTPFATELAKQLIK